MGMTREEKIICKEFLNDADKTHSCNEYKLLMALLEQEPRWIPVSEKLPDTDDEVLCWYEYYHWSREKVLPEYGLGRYLRETSAWFGEVANGRDVRVIAWMPLPNPYNAESEVNK